MLHCAPSRDGVKTVMRRFSRELLLVSCAVSHLVSCAVSQESCCLFLKLPCNIPQPQIAPPSSALTVRGRSAQSHSILPFHSRHAHACMSARIGCGPGLQPPRFLVLVVRVAQDNRQQQEAVVGWGLGLGLLTDNEERERARARERKREILLLHFLYGKVGMEEDGAKMV